MKTARLERARYVQSLIFKSHLTTDWRNPLPAGSALKSGLIPEFEKSLLWLRSRYHVTWTSKWTRARCSE